MAGSSPVSGAYRRLELARRLNAFVQASAFSLPASLATVLVLTLAFAHERSGWIMYVWAGAASLLIVWRTLHGRTVERSEGSAHGLRRDWQRTNAILSTASVNWGLGLLIAAWLGGGRLTEVYALIGGAALCSVLLIHRATPLAAVVHILSVSAGLIGSLALSQGAAAWPLMLLVVVIAASLYAALRQQDRQFVATCRIEHEHRESEKTVRLLLNEYEAQAADWLWTIGVNGALREVSDRFADVLGQSAEDLEGVDFLSLIERGPERERIAALIKGRTAFRDEPVPVKIDGQTRFWRLSAHPRSDGRLTGVGRDVTDQQAIEERVRYMAHYDPLTGLANRHLFNQRLRDALASADEKARQVALLYLDLDDFKTINDTQGHNFGDSLLREVGARLRREANDGELVARLGGDEFAMLIETAAGDGMLIERAHRLLAAVREPFPIEGQLVRMSTSVGGARGSRGMDAIELMRRVDLALYAAKARGRDALAMFDETLDQVARDRRNIRMELADALARGELALFYQPIIALDTGRTVAYEALLRWRHPERGLMMPDQFLPIAEESGLIIPLGDWVIDQALRDASAWNGDFRLSINLSPSQTRHDHLIAAVEEGLSTYGFAADRLEFEITEHVLIKDAAAGAAMLERLRALGVQVALDDFGTGYSSLSYLRKFPFDRIKIDRTFVADIESSDDARAIVSTLTRLAEALGMRTTAEGIESSGQLDLLRKLGCNEAQGFLIMEPVEASQVAAALEMGRDLPDAGGKLDKYRSAREAAEAREPRVA